MFHVIVDTLPVMMGQLLETVIMAYFHPIDALMINLLLTLVILLYSDEAYVKFVIGLWIQFAMILAYDFLNEGGEKRSVLISTLV